MKFYFVNRNGNEIELDVREKITSYSCLASLKIDGKQIVDNKKAGIVCSTVQPEKLFLNFSMKDTTINADFKWLTLCICDLSVEKDTGNPEEDEKIILKNREIASYLWKTVQDSDMHALSYPFTIDHRRNWED